MIDPSGEDPRPGKHEGYRGGEAAEVGGLSGDQPLIKRASVGRNLAQMASSQLVTWTLATIAALIIPRYLGPTNLGRISLAWSLWGIAAVFTMLGTSTYLQLAIAKRQTHGLGLVAPILAIRTGLFVLASLGLGGYLLVTNADGSFAWVMVLAGLAALFTLWHDVFRMAFMGLETMATVAVLTMAAGVGGLVATVAVLALGYGVFGVLWVAAAVAAFTLVGFVWSFRKVSRVDWSLWRTDLRSIITGSIPFMIVGLALAMYRQVDVIVIAEVAGERDLGWYSAADTLFGSLLFPTTVIVATVFPTMGRLHAEDPEGLRDLVKKMFSLLFLVAVPIGAGVAAVGPSFAPMLFGEDFTETGTLLSIFGPLTILTFGTTLLGSVAVAMERQRFVAAILFGAALVTIPLDIVLVPWAADRFDNGAIGGALAFVVTECLQFGIMLSAIAPYLVTRSWLWTAARVVGAGVVMFAAVWPIREMFVLVPAAVGAIVYIVMVGLLRLLDDYQRETLRNLVAKIRPKH